MQPMNKYKLFFYLIELSSAIHDSFKPNPEVIVLQNVIDAKGWMQDQTSPLHDHLKAHQFKFQRNCNGQCRMFYKEWSTDNFWLPQQGLSILPTGNSTPSFQPRLLSPCFDPEILKRLESTVHKISAYLDKAGTSTWWAGWLDTAKNHTNPQEPKEMQGMNIS